MRVVTGEAKGHRLKSVKKSVTRPTTALVRGAIFSILETMSGDWSLVLDLYAGSGALGIEALSRGASWVDFVEQNTRCCAVIEENLSKTGLAARARVHCYKAHAALSRLDRAYDLILLDPPYSDPSLAKTLEELCGSRLVGDRTTIVVQHSRHQPLPQTSGSFNLFKGRRYGETCVSIYRRGGAS